MRFFVSAIALLLLAACRDAPFECTQHEECGSCGLCENGLCVSLLCPGTDAEAIDAEAIDAESIDAEGIDAELIDAQARDADPTDSSTIADAGDADADPDPDASADAMPADAMPADAAVCVSTDGGTPDAGCGFNQLTRCDNGDHAGLCRFGVCGGCADVVDDLDCAQQYSGNHICVNGECVPGDCRSDVDCDGPLSMAGRLCGLSRPNFCDGCGEDDSRCQESQFYGASFSCNPSNGTLNTSCEPNTCINPRHQCANPFDYCCSTPSGNQCVPGRCCVDLDCTGVPGSTCIEGSCTQSAFCPPAGNILYVSPSGGSDFTGNGSQPCPFSTLSHALAITRRSTTPANEIMLLATGTTWQERNPILVPENVQIVGDPAGGARIEAGRGFLLNRPNSGVSNLTIDGVGFVGTLWGVRAGDGSTITTTIDHVTVTNMGESGIIVGDSAVLSIGPGVVSVNNRTGLLVDDQGTAIIEGSLTSDPAERISFTGNLEHGILVRRSSHVTISGAVFTTDNGWAGLRIEQIPSATLLNDIDTLVARSNGHLGLAWSGIDIRAGSRVRVRRSETLANHASGIRISTHFPSFGTVNDEVSQIDLGADPSLDPGENTLQSQVLADQNAGAGICLELSQCAGAVLQAEGNIFGPNDCSGSTPGPLSRSVTCSGAVDVGTTAGSVAATANCP